MNLFFVFLGTAAWQDLRTRSISLEVLAGGAAAGIITCIWKERLPGEIVLAMIPGIMLLLIGMLTRGLLGEGDGWFFIVSGFFLGWQECVMLLISGADFLRNIWACDNGRRTDRNWKGKYPKTAAAVFAVSFTCVTVDGAYEDDMRKTTCIKKYYSASITVEASIILSVVLLSLAAFIRYAYTVHDTVTGSMILEETLERARNNVNEKKTIDSFEQEGSQMGNPRLYLGAYELHLNLGALTAEGDAAAGDWSLHIERADIHPETFLRQQDALKKIKDRIDD